MTGKRDEFDETVEPGLPEEGDFPEEAENDPADPDDEHLKKKYEEQTRQIFPQKIELPISTLVNMVAAQIDLAPSFQRRDVWDVKKQSKFVESLIMNVPIPPVFMGEDSYGKYVVLDGRQRLTALVKFLKNEYRLVGLNVWTELNGDQFSDLEAKKLEGSLLRRFLPATILLKESSPEVKYDVFERLNTGGLNLNAMEIRNAVYPGEFTRLLHECAQNRNFRDLWAIPHTKKERDRNAMYRRMADLEQVLRFFALSAAQETKAKRAAFKTYLGTFMEARNAEYEANPSLKATDKARFETASENCLTVFGAEAFVTNSKRSAPLADALMYAVEPLARARRDDPEVRAALVGVRASLLANPRFVEALGQGTNGRAKIEQRLGLARTAVIQAAPT